MSKSTPYFNGFIPFGYQCDVLDLLYHHDYSKYTPEILLSGSVGSAKSILCAHWAIMHCLRWPGARIAISRQSLPDLRKTIFQEIIEHMHGCFTEGIHFKSRSNTCEVKFSNGSEIIAVSFGDRRYSKVRSLKLSGIIIEEATDFDEDFFEEGGGFIQFKARLRRIHNVPENFLILASNPGSPDSFLYDYFIKGEEDYESRYVFYSITTDNPFLDPIYVDQLRQDYSFLEAERFLRGKWISLEGKGIYHAYRKGQNFLKKQYVLDESIPIHVCFDFNVDPMSACVFQLKGDQYHVFDESIVDNSNWCLDCLEDLEARGVINTRTRIIVHGDATGNARNTASKSSNYELIRDWLTNRGYSFQMKVPRSNPPIVTRHVKVNALCRNDYGQIRLFIYKACAVLDQGLKLTRFKKGTMIEDDSKRFQHVTTALGYGLFASEKIRSKANNKSRSYERESIA